MRRALITGITGQDGSYLADLLLDEGYDVFGVVRRSSQGPHPRVDQLRDHERVQLLDGDLLDAGSLLRAVEEAQPHEVYNLAAQSFVGRSWKEPVHTAEVTGLGCLRLLEAVRAAAPEARFYQASTSELFGNQPGPLTAKGPFRPRSPYGSAKLFAHATTINYRESFGLFTACGILFNHESPRRGPEFVTRKICIGAAQAARGRTEPLRLGNLDARRDWGWAPDYVRAMWLMLQHTEPVDLVVASGTSHSVRDLCRIAYDAVGLDWQDHVVVDEAFLRPADVETLVGDPSEAEELLGWTREVDFAGMIRRMVAAELD